VTISLGQAINEARGLVLEAEQHDHLSMAMIASAERLRRALMIAEKALDSSGIHVRAAQLRSDISDLRQSLDALLEQAKSGTWR
jgi:hypothetical protein